MDISAILVAYESLVSHFIAGISHSCRQDSLDNDKLLIIVQMDDRRHLSATFLICSRRSIVFVGSDSSGFFSFLVGVIDLPMEPALYLGGRSIMFETN